MAVYGKADITYQTDLLKRGADIVVATPGRLIDLLQRGAMKLKDLEVLCLDEADEMLKVGFKEEVQKIYAYVKEHSGKKTQNLLFSATVPDWLKDIANTYLDPKHKYVNLIREDALTTP